MKNNVNIKRIAVLFAVLLLISVMPWTVINAANTLDGYVCDKAGVFSAEQIENLNSKILSKTGGVDCDIYILTENKFDKDSGDEFVDDYDLESNNIILLVIYDNVDRNFDVFTYGKAFKNISDREFNLICDHATVYDNIKGGNYYDGALGFIDQSLAYYSADDNGRSTTSYFGFWHFFWFGIAMGSLTAVVTAICIICSYKRKLRSAIYPLERYARLDLKIRNEQFMGSFVTRRVIRTSSGGGGGRSGGGGRRGGR